MFEKQEYDLSILIPARNEEFLAPTVKNILENIEARTEIIVGLDGEWAVPSIIDDPRVTIVYYPKSIGQRAMTNQLCKLSNAKYVAKVDAHTCYKKGFDRVLLDAMKGHDDWTVVPVMKNLHAFDWVCKKCGNRWYQAPTPKHCVADYNDSKILNKNCDSTEFEREIVFAPRKRTPRAKSYKFDITLHFQYFSEYQARPEFKQMGDHLSESMSLQGSFFMLTREKYWELNICDEKHGSWGQQGVEVAMKTWLSGGKVICVHDTWYAHMFRTQGGDFGFPYEISGRAMDKARNYSRDIWLNNKFEKQIYPLSWVLEKFKPLLSTAPDRYKDWHDEDPESKVKLAEVIKAGEEFYARQQNPKPTGGLTKGIIYYTDNQLKMSIARGVRKELLKAGLPIVSSSLNPLDFGTNIHVREQRGYLTMFKQILACLEASTADIIYFCEHDVLYPVSHFEFTPSDPNTFYYNINVWKLREDGLALKVNECRQVSGIAVYRETALKHYRERVAYTEKNGYNRNMGFEPGTHKRIDWGTQFSSENFASAIPLVDIRHDHNLTPNRWSPDEFRNKKNTEGWTEAREIPGWGDTQEILKLIK